MKFFVAALLLFTACMEMSQAQLSRRPGEGIPVNRPDAQGVSKTWSKLAPADLAAALRAGGHVLLFRHGRTDWRSQDQLPQKTFDDRSTQRQLSDEGRQQAREIGDTFSALGVRFDKVVSSPYFRTRDFAELAAGRTAEVDMRLLGMNRTGLDGHRELLGRKPQPGLNTLLSGHQFAPVDLGIVKMNELEEGSCLIFIPGGDFGKFELIAHLNSADIKALLQHR